MRKPLFQSKNEKFLKIGHSPTPFNIKAENILLDEKGNIFITDHIDPFNHETMNLHNEDLLNIGKIMLFVVIYDGNNLDLHKNINYRLLLHNHRDNFPKGIYEIIYIALESDPALQIDINELYSKAAFIKKKQKYKETSKDKETLENEAFMLRKAKETTEQSIQQKLRSYVENIENQGFSETITLSKHLQKVFSC